MPVEGGGNPLTAIWSTAIHGLTSTNPNAGSGMGVKARTFVAIALGVPRVGKKEAQAFIRADRGQPLSTGNLAALTRLFTRYGLPLPSASIQPPVTSISGPSTLPSSANSGPRRRGAGRHYYRGRDGKYYPHAPREWTGTREQWESVCRSRGQVWNTLGEAEAHGKAKFGEKPPREAPPKRAPPKPEVPKSPDAPRGDVFPWIWLAQTVWENRDEITRAVFRTKLHIPTPAPKPPAVSTPTFTPKPPQLPPQPALTVPRITARRLPVPKRKPVARVVPAPKLEVPTIYAHRLPTPRPTPRAAPTPAPAKPSLLSRFRFDPLTLAYLLPRGATVTGGKLRLVGDPLTGNIQSPLTSPLGSFAGVPSTPDCSCSKSPRKRGKRKQRTVCYEGSYRETARGTRKLRRRKVACT